MLLLGPGDALATLLIGGLRGGSLAPFFLEEDLLPLDPPELVWVAGAGGATGAVSTFAGATTPSVFNTPSWFS